MNDFKKPVRLIDHPGDDFTGIPATSTFSLGAPTDAKPFKVSLENNFTIAKNCETVFDYTAQRAASRYGEKTLQHAVDPDVAEDPPDDAYVKVYVCDSEDVVTAWVVTAHVQVTYSAAPGSL